MRLKTTILQLILLALTVGIFNSKVYAAHALPEFKAKYVIEKYGIDVAEARYRLSYTTAGYKFTQFTELQGVASLFSKDTASSTSLIENINNNLLLTKHEYIQTGRKKNKNEKFEILWQSSNNTLNGNVTGIVRSEKINLHTNTKVWDALSFQIPLMIDANSKVKEYPYRAILKGKINTYNFVLTSTKKINYAGAEYNALQMVRTDPNKDRQLHIWLIPKLNNIPILIKTYRKGKEDTVMRLKQVQFNNEKPLVDKTTNIYDDDEF